MARISTIAGLIVCCASLGACGGGLGSGNVFGGNSNASQANQTAQPEARNNGVLADLFSSPNDNVTVAVNKYLWKASLETLNFLPVEAADPFSGVMVLGWGKAPGSGTQFRATVLVQDPALEAGSLKVSMQKRSGPASAETNRRIEDAILTRARQLRIRDAKRR